MDTTSTIIISLTRPGTHLAARLAQALGAHLAVPARFRAELDGHEQIASFDSSVLEEIRRRWEQHRQLILVMASGVAVRAIAPLLGAKSSDPAVVCLDEAGRWAIPLLGGHQAEANHLARRIAAVTGGHAAITTASDVQGKPALDQLGKDAGWRLDPAGAITHASASLVNDATVGVYVDPELPDARELADTWLEQADNLVPVETLDDLATETYAAGVIVSIRALDERLRPLLGKSVLYRPPALVAGIGCRRGVPVAELRAALLATLADAGLAPESIGALATVDLKADEDGLRELAAALQVPLRIIARERLAALDPAQFSPSAAQAKFDLPGVAEPCAVLTAGGPLLVPKRRFDRCTIAVALRRPPQNQEPRTKNQEPPATQHATRNTQHATRNTQHPQGRLTLIGIGPGDPQQMTIAAREALRTAQVVVGYQVYIEQVRPLLTLGQQVIASPIGSEMERAGQAVDLAAAGASVALISSGDIGIYAMAGPVFEVLRGRGWRGETPEVVVLPGISAVQAVAARLGAPLSHDFCTISLSDLLTPWEVIEQRLWASARADFILALYNPRSRERDWQLARAMEILRTCRPPETPIAVARNITRPDEFVTLTTLAEFDPTGVDMFTLVLVGNRQSFVLAGRMATPRGYTSTGD